MHINRPKEAVKVIKSRLMKKNPRIQWLTLELLGDCMDLCSLPFHQQVCTKEFMQGLITVLRIKEIPPQIITKTLRLIQQWAFRFKDQKDILPLYAAVYEELQRRGYTFESDPKIATTSNKYSNQETRPSYEKSVNIPKQFIEDVETILLTNVA